MEKLSRNKQVEPEVLHEYKSLKLSPDRRTADLLKHMTIEEKVAQMLCIWEDKKTIFYDDEGNFSLEKISKHLINGVGQITRLSDTNGGLSPVDMAQLANTLQKFFVESNEFEIMISHSSREKDLMKTILLVE